jgi:hypothetical protein
MRQSGSGVALSGNTGTLATVNGSLSSGHLTTIDGSGNVTDAGSNSANTVTGDAYLLSAAMGAL